MRRSTSYEEQKKNTACISFEDMVILSQNYKRVGSMMHNGDRGRGVIGVIDVTNLMVIVGSFSTEGQMQLKSGNSDTFGTPATFVSGASAARSPPSLGTLSECSGGPVSPHNQLVETSNSSPSGIANLPWR